MYRSNSLHEACRLGNLDCVKDIVDSKACPINGREKDGWTPLHMALDHPQVVEFLLNKQHCDVNAQDVHGNTPLHIACGLKAGPNIATGPSNVAALLVGHSATEINSRNDDGNTPLHIACREGDIATVKVLLCTKKAELNCSNNQGDTPLHMACTHPSPKAVEELLSQQCCACDVNARNENGNTPLHVVCQWSPNPYQKLCATKLLLAHADVEVNVHNADGDTPLHMASVGNLPELVKILLAHVNIQVNVQNRYGDTPLYLASLRNLSEHIDLLLSHRDIHVSVQNKDGITPLHLVCEDVYSGMVNLLVDHSSAVINSKDNIGNTPLHVACRKGNVAAVEVLLGTGRAELTCHNDYGDTPLHMGCAHPHIVELLLSQQHCDVNARNERGDTPLHLACQWSPDHQYLSTAKLLQAHAYINVNAQSKDGNSPLHKASINNLPEHVELLLAHPNIEVNLTNIRGNTPLHEVCVYYSYFDIVQMLASHTKIQINTTDKIGNTPLHIACRKGHVAIAKVLLSIGADPTCLNLTGQSPLEVATDYEIVQMLLQLHRNKTDHPIESFVKLFVVGNSGAGKSTLISCLCEEASSFKKLFPSQYRRIARGVEAHTAGIIPLQFHSKRFGNVVLYDFAGHLEYYSSHSAVLENTITSTTPIFIVVVDVSASQDEITANLRCWLLFIENHTTKTTTSPHIIVVGSHIDKVKSRGESIEEKSAAIVRAFGTHSASIKYILHDCRDVACTGLDQLYSLLANSCSSVRESSQVDLRCHVLYAFLLGKFPNNAACRVRDISAKITEKDFFIPRDAQTLFTLLKTLSDKGQLLLLQSSDDPAECFVVLKMAELLHEVNGTLFAPHKFRQHRSFSNSTGLSSRSRIEAVFPLYDPKMIIGYLEQMEFCRKIGDALTVFWSTHDSLTGSVNPSEDHYFFPALIQDKSPPGVWKENDGMKYQFGWCLQCSEPDHYLSYRFHEVLLLRLAFSFACAPEPQLQVSAFPVLTRCCSVWKNGIQWLDLAGIETVVEVRENGTVVMVMMRCMQSALIPFAHIRTSVLKTVLEAKHQLCPKTVTREYLVNPSDLQYPPRDTCNTTLYSLPRVAEALLTSQLNTIDQYGENIIEINALFSFEPLCSLNLKGDIMRELFNTQQSSDSLLKKFLANLVSQATQPDVQHSFQESFELSTQNLSGIVQEASKTGGCFIQKLFEAWLPYQKPTFQEVLRQLINQYSILCGRNLLEIAGQMPHQSNQVSAHGSEQPASDQQLLVPEVCTTHHQTTRSSPSLSDHPTSHHLQFLVVPGRPRAMNIIEEVASVWDRLGRALGLEESILSNIFRDVPSNCELACERMLQKWLSGRGHHPVSWSTLITALSDISKQSLSEDLEFALN